MITSKNTKNESPGQSSVLLGQSYPPYLRKKRFLKITKSLVFTDATPLAFCNKFWQVRQMIRAWNKNMANFFVATWVMCLDESMSI